MTYGDVLWAPPADIRERSGIGRYLAWLERERGLAFEGYPDLWRWSVEDLAGFWGSVWDHFELGAPVPADRVLTERTMPGARWFPDSQVNYAARVLQHWGKGGPGLDKVAVRSISQTREPVTLTGRDLAGDVFPRLGRAPPPWRRTG